MVGLSFENADELLERVRGVLRGIEKVTLRAVFLEWMERLRKCLATNQEYVEESKINIRERLTFIRTPVRSSRMRRTSCTSHFSSSYLSLLMSRVVSSLG
jgi:hypothetical protein